MQHVSRYIFKGYNGRATSQLSLRCFHSYWRSCSGGQPNPLARAPLGGDVSSHPIIEDDKSISKVNVSKIEGSGCRPVTVNSPAVLHQRDLRQHIRLYTKRELSPINQISECIWQEAQAHVNAALLQSSVGTAAGSYLLDCVLYCPSRGAHYYLDEIVDRLSVRVKADVISLESLLLERLLTDVLAKKDCSDATFLALQSLSYHDGVALHDRADHSQPELEDDEGTMECGEEEGDELERNLRSVYAVMRSSSGLCADVQTSMQLEEAATASHNWLAKLRHVLEALMNTRTSMLANNDSAKTRRTILYLRDMGTVLSTPLVGEAVIKFIQLYIQERREAGESIMLLGSICYYVSPNDVEGDLRRYDDFRTVLIPPTSIKSRLDADDRRYHRYMNIEHIKDTVRQRNIKKSIIFESQFESKDTEKLLSDQFDNEVWPLERVHRLSSVLLNQYPANEKLKISHLLDAATILSQVDSIGHSYKQTLAKDAEFYAKPMIANGSEIKQSAPAPYSNYSIYEKKLLPGLVRQGDIDVGFSDVKVPPKTINALKSVVSLALTRPEAFKYGILARNRITGVLLFGPPGSGKTLLAKALAKESGANVLEIKSSEIFDKYVGEGNKNVQAIFSLARKLRPCVIFLDEVDAVFGARGGGDDSYPSRREVINQFMSEWDGLKSQNHGILVMGATNRPFDLDDAVIRRMPYRILVDLATEADRLDIFRMHLKDEIVHAEVDIGLLAQKTNFYSGSDIRNVVVATALHAVNEQQGKRILLPRHFQKALNEIGPSVSENAATLVAIRRWDAQYGDDAIRRRKPYWGFGELHGTKGTTAS